MANIGHQIPSSYIVKEVKKMIHLNTEKEKLQNTDLNTINNLDLFACPSTTPCKEQPKMPPIVLNAIQMYNC